MTKKTRNTGGGGGAEAIPWQGILEEYAGEENRVKDREAPGDQLDLVDGEVDVDENGDEVDLDGD